LRHRLERRHVVDLLVDLAEFGFRISPSGKRNHRRMREIRIAQTGGQIERADDLRHAHAGLAARARIAVRHISGGLLAVAMDARDLRAALHLGEGAAENGGNHENMRDAVAGEHGRQELCPGWHYLIASGFVGEPTAPVIGIAGATKRNSYTLSAAQSSARSFT